MQAFLQRCAAPPYTTKCKDLAAPRCFVAIARPDLAGRKEKVFSIKGHRRLPSFSKRGCHSEVVCRQGGRVPEGVPNNSPAPIVRRQTFTPAAQTVYLQLSQISNLQVIARSTGRSLGTVVNLLVDPVQCQVTLVDVDVKTPSIQTSIPLYSLRQIGDVILVQDDDAMYQQYNNYLAGRNGLSYLTGLAVRTRAGRVLGKVRDFSFSPDNGQIARIIFDNFGLDFLPYNCFDLFSVQLQDILSIGRQEIIVTDEAEFRQRKESSGIFGLIPSLLKAISPRDGVADAYRLPGGAAAYLPRGYNTQQWMADVQRWEAETGLRYEDYMAQQQQPAARPQPPPPAARAALPPPSQTPYPTASYDPRVAARTPQYVPVPSSQPRYGYASNQQQMRPPPVGQPAGPDPRNRQPMNPSQPSGPTPRYGPAEVPGPGYSSQPPRAAEQPLVRPLDQAGPAGYDQAGYSTPRQQQQQQRPQVVLPPAQPPQQSQQPAAGTSQPQQPAAGPSRRMDEWLAPGGEERPRMSDVLGDGPGNAAAGGVGQRAKLEPWPETNLPVR